MQSYVLMTSAGLPARKLSELLAYAKANPGKLNYASPGHGSSGHLAMAYFAKLAAIEMVHIPFKSTQDATNDVLAGRSHALIVPNVGAMPFSTDQSIPPLAGNHAAWLIPRTVRQYQQQDAQTESGIESSVWLQDPTCYGNDNSYVADAVAAYPERFDGVYSVDMVAPDAPEKITYWKGKGLGGLRVFIAGHTTAHDARLDDPRSFPAWQCAAEAGLPICVQVRPPGLVQLQILLGRFPKARVVLDHIRRPGADDAGSLFGLAKYPNLTLKLTTHNGRDAQQSVFSRVIQAFGAH